MQGARNALVLRVPLTHDPAPSIWEKLPFVNASRRRAFDRLFESFTPDMPLPRGQNLFRGVYPTREAAMQALPANRPEGYDNTASGELYLGLLRLVPQDYPALYWVRDGVDAGRRWLVDLGGSVGIKYYAFRHAMTLPDDLRWTVVDMPAVIARGRTFGAERSAGPQLEFEADLARTQGCDLLFASGSVQYLPQTLGATLAGWATRPHRIVVNTTPLHPTRTFYTVNALGTAYCPYRIQSHAEFVREFTTLGYRVRDHWACVGRSVHIPFHQDHDVDSYSGFCFDPAR
jgi:putative methyltransferase (TIGR04325 family)